MGTSAIGVFDDRGAAERALAMLEQQGFSRAEIDLVGRGELHELGGLRTPRVDPDYPRGATMAGTIAGAVAGLLIAIGFLSLAHGALRIVGALVAFFGPIALGAGLGASIGTITGAGLPEEQADYYKEAVERGGTLLIVAAQTKERARRAADVMYAHGSIDLEHRVEAWHGSSGADEVLALEPT
jgi:hypothetical protein